MPRLPAALCLFVLAAPARSGDFVQGGNGGTLARAFALPALGAGPVLARGHVETRWTLDVTNEYVNQGDCAVECITLDGETARLRYAYRLGLGSGWEFALEQPMLDRGGGFLDGWIEDWHHTLGLPNDGRELAEQDQYRFRYARQNAVLLDETRGGTGLGDTTLTLARSWGRTGVLRAMAKLPTGDERELEGGTAGYAIWIERALVLAPGGGGYFALGVSHNELGPVLPQMQNRMIAFGGLGLLFPVTRSMSVSAQLQAHGRLYDGTTLTPLARAGVPLTLGLQFRTGARGAFELGFQEDPSVDGSPDFSAYLSFRATTSSARR